MALYLRLFEEIHAIIKMRCHVTYKDGQTMTKCLMVLLSGYVNDIRFRHKPIGILDNMRIIREHSLPA